MAVAIASDDRDTFLRSKVLTINILNQDGGVKASCTNTSGAAVLFAFGLDDTVADLEAKLRTKTPWLEMKFLSNDGIVVDTCQKLSDIEQIVVMDMTNEKRLEFWKEKYPVVGKVLSAMSVDAFDPMSQHFDLKWTGSTAPVADPSEIDQLIVSALQCNTYKHQDNPREPCVAVPFPSCPEIDELEHGTAESIAVSIRFVQVLGFLLEDAEKWNPTHLQLLQNFDPGMKFFKHKLYPNLVEVARLAAVKPLSLMSLPLVAVFRKNLNLGRVIGLRFCVADREHSCLRLDRYIQLSLYLCLDTSLHTEFRNWTYRDMLLVLRHMEPDVQDGQEMWPVRERYDLSKDEREKEQAKEIEREKEIHLSFPRLPSIEDESIPSILLNLQLRLSSEVCPVVVHGTLNVELVRFLAFALNYHLTILQDEGDHKKFRDVGLLEISDDDMPSNSLGGHTKHAQTKANALKSRGTLLLITNLAVGSNAMMASECQRLKDLAMPNIIRFVLLEDSSLSLP